MGKPMQAFWAHRLKGDTMQSCGIQGGWELSKPLPAPLSWRLRAAWEVVTGRAEIIRWVRDR